MWPIKYSGCCDPISMRRQTCQAGWLTHTIGWQVAVLSRLQCFQLLDVETFIKKDATAVWGKETSVWMLQCCL